MARKVSTFVLALALIVSLAIMVWIAFQVPVAP